MSHTSLTPELVAHATNLASALAQSQKVIAAKARIGLFYQNPEATDLFRKVSEYGEELRNKHMAGMAPSESELAKFDEMRAAVVANEVCKNFLEARQELDDMLGVLNQYMVMAIEKGCAPTDEEVAASLQQQMSACSCGGGCHGSCEDCDNEHCDHKHEGDHECCCGGHHEEGHECCCGGHHEEDHECTCGGHHEDGHECCCKNK